MTDKSQFSPKIYAVNYQLYRDINFSSRASSSRVRNLNIYVYIWCILIVPYIAKSKSLREADIGKIFEIQFRKCLSL